jgi:hypothetical protein
MDLGVRLYGASDAVTSVLRESDALDRELVFDAELGVSEIARSAYILGAFQRAGEVPMGAALVRRVSGGALLRVGPGSVHVALALRSPSALVPCDAPRLMNRYVRPLLRAITKGGSAAHYFGRDWVSAGHRPVAAVGFAHDSGTGRAVFEAFVAVRVPFDGPSAPLPQVDRHASPRRSFQGKEPGTLEDVKRSPVDSGALARRIVEAYAALPGVVRRDLPARSPSDVADGGQRPRAEPPWEATVEEEIGPVSAGRDARGTLRLGGDFLASRDAVAQVEAKVLALGASAAIDLVGTIVDQAFSAPAAIVGVRELGSVRDALLGALAQKRA